MMCTDCVHYIVSNNNVCCDLQCFDKNIINESLLYTPLDFDCIEFLSKEKEILNNDGTYN